MKYNHQKFAGALLFAGAAQFIICMIAAEALYPGYSTASNWISDLGVGQTAALFNASIFLLGLCIVIAAVDLFSVFRSRLLSAPLLLAGLGAMGVGLFPETTGRLHFITSMIAFVFGGLSAIAAYRVEKPPLNYFSAILGTMALIAIVLPFIVAIFHVPASYFGPFFHLGLGGTERMVAYPVLLWAIGFGGYLMASRTR